MVVFKKEEAEERLRQLNGWQLVDNTIEKNYKFANFREAIAFINKVANIAEAENHHPDILLWSWNNVKLTFTTHKVGGLSQKDFTVAGKIDKTGQ